MNREEAIERIKQNKAAAEFHAGMVQNTNAIENELKDIEAMEMAIEALTQDSRKVTQDLIIREDAIALVIKAIHGTDNKEIQEYLFDGLRKQMWSLPSADAVEVVRCKDCKHWAPHTQCGFDEDNDAYHDYCGLLIPDDDFYAYTRMPDDYCSYGER